jgi:hypothetical protein
MTGQSLKSERRYEFQRASSHDHSHLKSAFDQEPDELHRFVAGDSTRHADDDHALLYGTCHGLKIPDRIWVCNFNYRGMRRLFCL